MNYILLHQSYGRESTRLTAEKMTEPCLLLMKLNSGDWAVQDPKTKEMTPVSSVMKILNDASNNIINWGNHIFADDSLFDLNVPSSIASASNKVRARRILQNAEVAVPRTYFPDTDANLIWANDCTYPIIVRPSHHHKGKNFNVFNNPVTLTAFLWGKNDWYASELFEKTHEFRVYVGHGKVLFVHNKPLVEGEIRANYAVNHESWPVMKWSEHIEVVNVESVRAVTELGLDYGAVDIMYNEATGQAAIAEVNTSPQITTPYTSGKFAEYFSWVIRHDFPDHFPLDGKSVFYNNILRD
jgi:hypothetical protein